jgi:putative SOS response-associated peptidase YedK
MLRVVTGGTPVPPWRYTRAPMCGRFTVRTAPRVKLDQTNNLDLPFEARFNIAPGQDVLVVADLGNGLELTKFVWGLIPEWSSDGKGFINARAETVETKPSFSEAFRRRRCLILADGFYEWRRTGRSKQAFYFQLSDQSSFAFAGVWDRWGRPPVNTCAIITTTANAVLQPVHDRMPVILDPESYRMWLDPRTNAASLRELLVPFPDVAMTSHPVSSAVNFVEREGPELITRVDFEVGTTPALF